MAALAYVLLPVSGFVAYVGGSTRRVRFHGLQAIALGLLWPLALYASAAIARSVLLVVAVGGAILWLILLIGAALGRDPRIPLVGGALARAAEVAPSDV